MSLRSRVLRCALLCLGVAGVLSLATAAYSESEDPTAPPFFSLAGGTYNSPQTLTLTDSTSGAKIYYTTNGLTPKTSSNLYTGPISISSTETVSAIAIAPDHSQSVESAKAYTFISMPLATPPYFSLAGGFYTTPQTLTLTGATPQATIYYTTDGTAPTTASTKYTGPITIKTSELVIAMAAAPGHANSGTSSKLYKFDQ
jgi:hypothetical protein